MDVDGVSPGVDSPCSGELGLDLCRGDVDSPGDGEDVDPDIVRLGDDESDSKDEDKGESDEEHPGGVDVCASWWLTMK